MAISAELQELINGLRQYTAAREDVMACMVEDGRKREDSLADLLKESKEQGARNYDFACKSVEVLTKVSGILDNLAMKIETLTVTVAANTTRSIDMPQLINLLWTLGKITIIVL